MAGGARRRILRRDDHDEKAPIGETVGMKRVIADRGYDANRIRATLREQGTIPVIPGHRNRKRPIQYDERRSEERSGGKECVSPCRARWSPYHKNKTKHKTK